MHISKPDPHFMSSKRAHRNFSLALKIALWVVLLLWFILIADSLLGLDLARFGLRPRQIPGLTGVFTAPLLHAGFEHLFSNTLPLLISLTAILYLYPASAMRVMPVIWMGSGLLAWFIGRPSLHFGASGFVYGLLAYVFIGGILRLDMRSVAVSVMVWFLYGSMIWGVLPIRPHMSWELHLSGAILGVALAIVYRRWDIAPAKRYAWEDDDSVPPWFPQRETPLEDASREVSSADAPPLGLESGQDADASGDGDGKGPS
jgi:membrane associated rhomboid family serine protease